MRVKEVGAEMTPDPFLVRSGDGDLEPGLLLVRVGDPAGDAGARAGQTQRGGGADVAALHLSAPLAGDDRLCADRWALSAAGAGGAAGAAYGINPERAGAAGAAGGRGGRFASGGRVDGREAAGRQR